jgi:hypothetical protein
MRIMYALLFVIGVMAIGTMAQQRYELRKHDEGSIVALRGQVQSTELRDVTRSGVSLVIKLKLELHNNGSKPVIFLNDPAPTITGATLNKVASDPPHSALVSDYRGPSVDTSSKWLTLRRSLDKAQPPSELVRILPPGESWWFEGSVDVALPTEAGKSNYVPRRATWESMQDLSPVWLHVNWEVWPVNVEPSKNPNKLSFGITLQRRWKNVGLLRLDGIYSEPIALDLKTATSKMKTP